METFLEAFDGQSFLLHSEEIVPSPKPSKKRPKTGVMWWFHIRSAAVNSILFFLQSLGLRKTVPQLFVSFFEVMNIVSPLRRGRNQKHLSIVIFFCVGQLGWGILEGYSAAGAMLQLVFGWVFVYFLTDRHKLSALMRGGRCRPAQRRNCHCVITS